MINCDIRGDVFGGVVKREPRVMYMQVFTVVYAHIWSCVCLGNICMLSDVINRSYMLLGELSNDYCLEF